MVVDSLYTFYPRFCGSVVLWFLRQALFFESPLRVTGYRGSTSREKVRRAMPRSLRDYNFFLLGCVIVLTGFSLAMVYSATLHDPYTHGYFSRHLVNLIVGVVAMLLLTALDYHALQAWARAAVYLVRSRCWWPCWCSARYRRRRAELAEPGAAHVSAIRAGQAADDRRAGGLLGALRGERRRVEGAARRPAAGRHPDRAGVHPARLRHRDGLRDRSGS